MIVAVNKIDKPDPLTPMKREALTLLQYEVQVESMGGEVQDVEVSALKKMRPRHAPGIRCSLQAELLELKANADREARRYAVVEAQLDKGPRRGGDPARASAVR